MLIIMFMALFPSQIRQVRSDSRIFRMQAAALLGTGSLTVLISLGSPAVSSIVCFVTTRILNCRRAQPMVFPEPPGDTAGPQELDAFRAMNVDAACIGRWTTEP